MTDITFGDRMGSNVMTLKPFSYQENYIVVYMFESCYYIFLFERVLIIHVAYKVFQEYINLAFCFIRPFIRVGRKILKN